MDKSAKIKILFVTSQAKRWASLEWLCQYLNNDLFEVSFAVLSSGHTPMASYLESSGVRVHQIHYTGKQSPPLSKGVKMVQAATKIARCCRDNDIDIVHAQFYHACIPALLGAFLAGIKWRIHTRHYAADPADLPRLWLWQRRASAFCINALSTSIVAPSLEVQRYLTAKEAVVEDKIEVIHHGFDLALFTEVTEEAVARMRQKHGIAQGIALGNSGDNTSPGPVIGVVSRYSFIKGIQYILPAFKRLLQRYPSAQLVLASAEGEYADQLQPMLDELPAASLVEITFEDDIFTLFHTFDLFIHVPIGRELEAFGQVYIEAMAAGIPSVFTLAGITSEVVNHKQHAWVVPHKSADAIHDGLCALLADNELRQRLIHQGKQLVSQRFSVDRMINAMVQYYQRQLTINN